MLKLDEEGTSTGDVASGPGDKVGPVLKRKKKLNNFQKTLKKLNGEEE